MRKIIKGTDLVTIGTDDLPLEPVIVPGSFDPPTTDAVAKAVGAVSDVIPAETSAENPLVNEQGLEDAIAAADLSGTPAEVAAAALCELKENFTALAGDLKELADAQANS